MVFRKIYNKWYVWEINWILWSMLVIIQRIGRSTTRYIQEHSTNRMTVICSSPHGPFSLTGFPSQFKCDGNLALFSSQLKKMLQNFALCIILLLPYFVQNVAANWWPVTELEQGKFSIEFYLQVNKSLIKWVHGWLRQNLSCVLNLPIYQSQISKHGPRICKNDTFMSHRFVWPLHNHQHIPENNNHL